MRFNAFGIPVFATQKDAFAYLGKQPDANEHRVIAREIPEHERSMARREFWVCTLDAFYNLYAKKLVPEQRTFHELIDERSQCHLYLDVELEREPNSEHRMKRGQEMLDCLIDECIAELERKEILPTYASSSSSSSSSVEEEQRPRANGMLKLVTLDSSAAYKLSRHYVFRIRNTAWASNAACGSFMQEFYERMLEQEARAARSILGIQADKEKPSELESRRAIGQVLSNAEHLAALERALCRPSFFVFTPSSREAASFVVDMQVYSKNRTFRMYQSSKPGGNRRFLQTVEEKRAQSFHPDETVFYQSLVTFFYNNGHRVTRVIEPRDFEHSKKRKLRDSAGMLPKKRVCAPTKGHDPIGLAEYFELECGYELHYESISFSAQYGTVLYPTKTRYCGILEKRTRGEYNEHSNNNVYMIVDPMRRTVRLQCHNQECKLYANESRNHSTFTKQLPEHLHSKLDAFVESHLRVSKGMDALYNFML